MTGPRQVFGVTLVLLFGISACSPESPPGGAEEEASGRVAQLAESTSSSEEASQEQSTRPEAPAPEARAEASAGQRDARRGRPLAVTRRGGAAPSQAGIWPQFRGPRGWGVSNESGLPTVWGPDRNVVWKTPLPGPGSSSPIVIGSRVFLTCYTGYATDDRSPGQMEHLKRHLLCLSLDDGSILWQSTVNAELPEQPYDGHLRRHGYASSTPVADAQRVYVFFGKSGLFAFDHQGRRLWHAEVGSRIHGWGSGTSPLLYKNLVIVNASVESRALVALDKATGREVWRAEGIREAWNTPILVDLPGGRKELAVAVFGKVLGLDPDTGRRLWNCDGVKRYVVPSLVAHEGVVYCIGLGTALAVRAGGRGDVTQTHVLWRTNKGSNVSSPIYHDGHLYFASDRGGVVHCLDAETGEVIYQQRLQPAPGLIYASPVLADGKLYYVSRQTGAYVLAARPQFEQLAHNKLDDRSVFNASPAAAPGRLLLRSDRFLYCIGTR